MHDLHVSLIRRHTRLCIYPFAMGDMLPLTVYVVSRCFAYHVLYPELHCSLEPRRSGSKKPILAWFTMGQDKKYTENHIGPRI